MTDALRYQLVLNSVRPPRAVTLVPAQGDWHADALRMIENYARTWGGDGNGLATCSSTGEIAEAFWPLLTALDADQWVSFARTPLGLRMSDPEAYEKEITDYAKNWAGQNNVSESEARQVLETDRFLSEGAHWFETADDSRIRNWLAPAVSEHAVLHGSYTADSPPPNGLVDMCNLDFVPTRLAELDLSALPPSVQLLVGMRTGLLGPAYRTHLQAQDTVEWATVNVDPSDLNELLEFAWSGTVNTVPRRAAQRIVGAPEEITAPEYIQQDFAANTPAAHARLGCSWFTRLDKESFKPEPLVIICGDSAEDFCYAFTRQRVTANTYWLPLHPNHTAAELARAMYNMLTRVLSSMRHSEYGPREILLSSLTLTGEELDKVCTALLATPWSRSYVTPGPGALSIQTVAPESLPVRRTWFLLDSIHFGTEASEPFIGADMARQLEMFRPSRALGARPEACRWRVDVERTDHILPARWALQNALTTSGGDALIPGAVRSSTTGISVDSHGKIFQIGGSPLSQVLTHTRLRFPGAAEVFATLLAQCGASMHESDKGRYTRRMLEMWGDLRALATDLQPDSPTRTLLKEWISKNQGHGRIHQERKYLRFSDIRRIAGLDKSETRVLLDRFQQHSIAHRGLVLQCRLCASSSFYHLADIGPGYQCLRCMAEAFS